MALPKFNRLTTSAARIRQLNQNIGREGFPSPRIGVTPYPGETKITPPSDRPSLGPGPQTQALLPLSRPSDSVLGDVRLPPARARRGIQDPVRSSQGTAPTDSGEARTREQSILRRASGLVGGEATGFGGAGGRQAIEAQGLVNAPLQSMQERLARATLPEQDIPRDLTGMGLLPESKRQRLRTTEESKALLAQREADRQAVQAEQQAMDEAIRRKQMEEAGIGTTASQGLTFRAPDQTAEQAGETRAQGIAVDPATGQAERVDTGKVTPEEGELQRQVQEANDAMYFEKSVAFEEDPDNTSSKGHTQLYWEHAEYDSERPETWPAGLQEDLKKQGFVKPDGSLDYERVQKAGRLAWVERYFPQATAEEKEVYMAILANRGAGGMYIDDDDGIIDKNGNPLDGRKDQIIRALRDDKEYELADPSVQAIVDNIQGVRQQRGINVQPDVGNAGERDQVSEIRDTIAGLDKEFENINLINPDELIQKNSAKMNLDKARGLRVAMNRMARSGSSPEAIQGMTAQLGQQADIMEAQQNAIIRFQAEQQNLGAQINVLQNRANVLFSLLENITNEDARREALIAARNAQDNAARMQALRESRANSMSTGELLGQIGLTVGGSVLGAFTGGLGTMAAGAVGTSLFGDDMLDLLRK